MATTLQHVCHVHPLELMGMSEMEGMGGSCGACGQPISSENLYGCRSCAFFLHLSCVMLLPSLQGHPAHQQHPLYLLSAPARPSGAFRCDICGDSGCSGFIYHCQTCNFDAHFLCPHMPRTASSRGHQHPLHLLFRPPTQGSTCCDACRLQIHHSCYKCSTNCDFVLHPLTEESVSRCLFASVTQESISPAILQAWAVTKFVARGAFKLLPSDYLGEVMDGLLNGSEDRPEINDIFRALFSGNTHVVDGTNSCIFDEITIDDLRDCFNGTDDPLQAEFVSLFHAHMEGMAAGETSVTSKPLSTNSNNGSTKKEPAS
ncbi:hypothetical protein EJ110_NYTH23884 [Nymphaea thermarum]|nr:hypothetical protein EJ110_NYTH23884 [Nymphaea thermarum]